MGHLQAITYIVCDTVVTVTLIWATVKVIKNFTKAYVALQTTKRGR